MKNQSLRGKLDVSMICVGAIEWVSKLLWVKECGGKQVQDERLFARASCHRYSVWDGRSGPKLLLVTNVVNWAQAVQIKIDEWTPYARMKGCIGLDNYNFGQSIWRPQ